MISTQNQSNYLARIVKLNEPQKHPNADALQGWTVNGNIVWTNMDYNNGDYCVYFPLECQINPFILKNLNLFNNTSLNQNPQQKGFFDDKGRVKAIKLRGVPSEGFILKIENFIEGLYSNNLQKEEFDYYISLLKQNNSVEFDTFNNIWICKKYVPVINEPRNSGTGPKLKVKLADILVDPFPFHYSTSKFQDNQGKFTNNDDIIVITEKLHGTSAVFSSIFTKRKLSYWERIKKFFGVTVQTHEWSPSYSSRAVIKHIDNKYHTEKQGYYNNDVWGKVYKDLKPILDRYRGITIYGEIVGYHGNKYIQKDYDYGCMVGECKFLVYRITDTNEKEFSWAHLQSFCARHNLTHVPELYYGTIGDFRKLYNTGDYLINNLKEVYLEKDCRYCTKKVPAEGITIRNESGDKKWYKLKSFRFLEKESKDLDNGIVDTETQESNG